VRISAEERQVLWFAAEQRQQSASAFVRDVCLREATKLSVGALARGIGAR
jgi:uncharacterized protein (DUF1778 family)